MANREIVYSTCKSCHGGCGVKLTKEDGVIVKIEGNYDSLTKGTMCSKGLSSIQHIDNPYRIKYPMKQAGKKGEGKWKRISWDEALETISAKMRDAIDNYGGHTIAVSQGTGRGYNRYTMRMARSLGSGNAITPGYVCHSPRLGLYALVTGYGRLYCDYHGWGGEFPKTQIMWAKQLEISSADSEMCYWFMRSLDYVKNLIIIDPRASAYATRASLWIQPRPGTDCALALGMMNVIIEEELWDKEFVDNWTFGFDELRERVKDFTPEKVSNICWIPKEDVITAARMWAIDTPGCIQVGSSLERQANCGHTLRAITCLMGLAGNIERPGSMVSWVLPDTGLIEDFNLELPITDEMKAKIIGGDRFKMGATRTCNPDTMVKAINAGEAPIKVWLSVGGQQIVHMANTKEVVAGHREGRVHGARRSLHGPHGRGRRHRAAGRPLAGDRRRLRYAPTLHDRGAQQSRRSAGRSQGRRLDLQRDRPAGRPRQVVGQTSTTCSTTSLGGARAPMAAPSSGRTSARSS